MIADAKKDERQPPCAEQTSWISVSCGDHSTQQVEVWITRGLANRAVTAKTTVPGSPTVVD